MASGPWAHCIQEGLDSRVVRGKVLGVHLLELLIAEQFLREGLSRGSTAYIIFDINTNYQGPSGHCNCPLTQGPIELVHTPAVSVSKEVALSTPHYLFRKLPGLFGYSKIARLQRESYHEY